MHLYFDESGDFEFPPDRFDVYTQAVVIVPDSRLPQVDEYVEGRCTAWDVQELHAVELSDEQLLDVCQFIRGFPLPACVQATDTNAVTREIIAAHRLDQAARTQANLEDWKRRGGSAPSIERWYERFVSAAAYARRISDSEYVQADFLINLVQRGLNRTITFFLDDQWRQDFTDFRFIFDGKLQGKRARGEKFLNDALLPALGSNRGRWNLIGVKEWRDPPMHPFEAKYGTAEGAALDLGVLFEHGLEFEPSHEHPGLQLADAVAYTARRRILAPANRVIRMAWQTLRPLLIWDGAPIRLVRYRAGGVDADSSRYDSL